MANLGIISWLVILLVVGGSLACLPLYRWNVRAFLTSSLGIKTWMWLPIYAVVLMSLLWGPIAGSGLVGAIMVGAVIEYRRQSAPRTSMPSIATAYVWWFLACSFAMAALYWILPHSLFMPYLITVYFGSVLSDVCAFFMGAYLTRPHLPEWINPRKSWMGVIGQIIGGVLGVLISAGIIGFAAPWWLGVVLGGASAVGDVINSVAKRQLAIKDWGNTIPGHGGVLDRCSSLSVAFLAALVVYIFVLR